MGLLDRIREGRNDRRQQRLPRDYTRQVDDWLRQCQRAIELALVAQRPGVSAANAPVELWEGERLLMWWTGADLIAPKNTIVRNWTSASYRVGKKTTVRAGTSTMHSTADRPTPIDRGTLAITDRRVLFLGRTRSIDWQFRRMLGVTHDERSISTAIHVSNGQRLHRIGYTRSTGMTFASTSHCNSPLQGRGVRLCPDDRSRHSRSRLFFTASGRDPRACRRRSGPSTGIVAGEAAEQGWLSI
jgi:hypothetical protein